MPPDDEFSPSIDFGNLLQKYEIIMSITEWVYIEGIALIQYYRVWYVAQKPINLFCSLNNTS